MTPTVRLIESLSPNQDLLQQVHERSLDVLETWASASWALAPTTWWSTSPRRTRWCASVTS
jgi:hypothetical protein